MTTNHPAHGPVSLDRLHQIREILSKAAAQSDGGNLGYAMADAVKVIDEVLNAEPVAYMTYKGYLLHAADPKLAEYSEPMPLYAAPQLPQPAVLSVSEGVLKSLLPDVEKSEFWFEHNGKIFFEGVRFNNAVFEACRAAMLQSFGNSEKLDEVGSWNNHMNTPTDKPAINTDELLKHIEGMEVSVDVSTCDADAGHRYFGTVTEISELDTARNGYILLVQDAKPNFKPAGNSPATPDGWQLVPKEPTEAMNKAGWAAMNEHDAINPTYRAMLAAAPQQDVRLALEIGMSRYAGAMQKLVDSGD
ncbi:hypothetical protein [Citrobacter sp. wls613]|uniref:hypothetical protein n=1 Tax=Citrobacter sp. wls613 TaxID=2576436 RepID=UPI001485C094|nr:hypothetical protein [Citrobacter sp. wls613]MDU7096889.1 hypothetical protein [Enterobacter sp.]MDU7181382.1 hypothetical protein [Enterobacter roggenkampii]